MNAQEYTLPRKVRITCPARISIACFSLSLKISKACCFAVNLKLGKIGEYRGLLALGSL